jgi:hypothetical protein
MKQARSNRFQPVGMDERSRVKYDVITIQFSKTPTRLDGLVTLVGA